MTARLAPEVREEIARLHGQGVSKREISRRLGIGPKTVGKYTPASTGNGLNPEHVRGLAFAGRTKGEATRILRVGMDRLNKHWPSRDELDRAGILPPPGKPLSQIWIDRIVELRHQGLSRTEVSKRLGIGVEAISKYSPPLDQLENVHPLAKARYGYHPLPEAEETVEPIPFYPDDLPYLDWTDGGFKWTKPELKTSCLIARMVLDGRAKLDLAA